MIKIVNQNENEVVCEISGDIVSNDEQIFKDWFGVDITTPNDVKDTLNSNKNANVTFNINSNGGDVFAGTAISNIIKAHKGQTVANIQSIGASIASVIALSCDKVRMPKNAYLMIHKPVAVTGGSADELRETANLLDKIQGNIEDVYMSKVKENITKEQISAFVNNETWFNGEEASQIFNIELLEDMKVLNCASNITHKKQPSLFNKKKEALSNDLLEKIQKLEKMEG